MVKITLERLEALDRVDRVDKKNVLVNNYYNPLAR
jgi:hypothetical protein